MHEKKLMPFLKWPGGKRWFINKYQDYFPVNYNTYIEPFLGGGAVYFSLHPKNAILADINEELINLYIIMRDRAEQLKDQMLYHQNNHNEEYYYRIRESNPSDPLEQASRMLYLNRACYNGMYRVNKQGMFNVPMGTKTNFVYDINRFEEYAEFLKNSRLICSDFYNVINGAKRNDLIFADPPYAIANKCGFIKYNDKLFTWEDQRRLHRALVDAKNRGVQIVLTNVYCQEIMERYKNEGFYIHVIERSSNISGKADKRGRVKELVITSNRKRRKRKGMHE